MPSELRNQKRLTERTKEERGTFLEFAFFINKIFGNKKTAVLCELSLSPLQKRDRPCSPERWSNREEALDCLEVPNLELNEIN